MGAFMIAHRFRHGRSRRLGGGLDGGGGGGGRGGGRGGLGLLGLLLGLELGPHLVLPRDQLRLGPEVALDPTYGARKGGCRLDA